MVSTPTQKNIEPKFICQPDSIIYRYTKKGSMSSTVGKYVFRKLKVSHFAI